MKKRALVSTSDKKNLPQLASCLMRHGYEIIASESTLEYLNQHDINAISIEEITQLPAMIGGRVKTLHPAIHAGILAMRNQEHLDEISKWNYTAIDIVVVNFYPFTQYLQQNPNADASDVIEYMDIGGPAMVRSAIKNSRWVGVITDPESYPDLIHHIDSNGNGNGMIADDIKKELAIKAAGMIVEYDRAIFEFLLSKGDSYRLRYGENPHQQDSYFVPTLINSKELAHDLKILQGKQLSYNNYLDLETVRKSILMNSGTLSFCVVIKHATICCAAFGVDAVSSYKTAFAQDKESSFGGIIGFNCEIDERTAQQILDNQFCEIVMASGCTASALEVFKQKPNIRVVIYRRLNNGGFEHRTLLNGTLYQNFDQVADDEHGSSDTNVQLAWNVCAVAKSNAIVIVSNNRTVAISSGYTSRVAAVRNALKTLEEKEITDPCCLASDGFFPFSDSIELISQHPQISTVIAPQGSIRDKEVERAAEKNNITLVVSTRRHFRH